MTLKWLHVTFALVSLALFIARGFWMMTDPQRLRRRWIRSVPHVVDAALLASAVALLWRVGGLEALASQSWIDAKIGALLVYIALGSIALKRGRTRRIRVGAFIAAIAVFGYIVSVAILKSPWGIVARFAA